MVTYRFSGRHSAVRTVMSEKGHRLSDPPRRGKLQESGPSSSPAPEPSLGAEPPHSAASVTLQQPSEITPALPRTRSMTALRQKIMDSSVVDILIEFVEGGRELSRDQVAAALELARKVIPDLANITPPDNDEDDAEERPPSEIEIHIVDPQA